MPPDGASVLTLNAGSSSIRFAFYRKGRPLALVLKGKLDRIGLDGTTLSWEDGTHERSGRLEVPRAERPMAFLLGWLERCDQFPAILGAGHRIVHGFGHREPARITADLLDDLRRAEPYAPDHLPREMELIDIFRSRYPRVPQIACFDTAFHGSMPRVATLLPIPRRYLAKGVRRYGFHGLSYAYVVDELRQVAGEEAAAGRVIVAHLGNGASMAAIAGGRSVDTTMGFTPAAGLMMSTRTGDLDPGIVSLLARTDEMDPPAFHHMVNHESGLLGVSEISPDMRDLLAREPADVRAAEAVALFCYQARKWVGALAAALGGLDTLVFTGGIGEGSAPVRDRICDGLSFLGIDVDPARNASHDAVISTRTSRVTVRVIPTNEELMIARSVFRMIDPDATPEVPDR